MTISHFTSSFFTGNRQRLRALVGQDYPIIIAGNGLLQRSRDTTYPFRQDSNFWYLTGIDKPDLLLVMTTAGDFIVAPRYSSVRSFFDGAIDFDELRERSGVGAVYDAKDGWAKIAHALEASETICTALPAAAYDAGHGMYSNPASRTMLRRLKRKFPRCEVRDIRSELRSMRVKKQPAEIEAIEHAVSITYASLDELRRAHILSAFQTESELEAAISSAFRARGAHGHAYEPIVASGPHATTLHYIANNGALKADELIVLDVGAEVENYAADITRTLANRPLSPRQKSVVGEVIGLQQFALSMLQPGTHMRDYEQAVHEAMGKALKRLGLITNEKDAESIWQYYPHATSHFMGLDVHDVGDYRLALEEGMVLTCEPGIYIPEEGIGVRIEDDVLITNDGYRILGGNCSAEPYTV